MIATAPYKQKHSTTINKQLIIVNSIESRNDPTKTLGLRKRFASDMDRRFSSIAKLIKQAIVDQDCFGLKKQPQQYASANAPTGLPGPGAFRFLTKEEKIASFMDWLKEQEKKGLLELGRIAQIGESTQQAWTNMYVLDSYKRGVIRSRYEMGKAGMPVPPIEQTGGIAASMATPFHIERVGLLYTRVFEELKGITAAMDSQISRVLAQGMIDGDGPALMARKMVQVVTGAGGDLGIKDTLGRFIPAKRRAMTLARTEVIRAHHLGMVQEYKNWAVEGVYVQAEWSTAGDDRVCPICEGMQGKVYTLKQIEGMIPAHPGCRCIALPKAVDEKKRKKKKETKLEDWQKDPVARRYKPEVAKEYMRYKKETDAFMENWNTGNIVQKGEIPKDTRMHSTKRDQLIRYLKSEGIYGEYESTAKNWILSADSNEALQLKRTFSKMDSSLKMRWPDEDVIDYMKAVLDNDVPAFSQSTFLKIQALNQSYMESLGLKTIKLYRGLGEVPEMREAINAGKKLHRTKFKITENNLTGFTDNEEIAKYFAQFDTPSTAGFYYMEEMDISQIFIHSDLFSLLVRQGVGESEFICIGGLRELLLKNIMLQM